LIEDYTSTIAIIKNTHKNKNSGEYYLVDEGPSSYSLLYLATKPLNSLSRVSSSYIADWLLGVIPAGDVF